MSQLTADAARPLEPDPDRHLVQATAGPEHSIASIIKAEKHEFSTLRCVS